MRVPREHQSDVCFSEVLELVRLVTEQDGGFGFVNTSKRRFDMWRAFTIHVCTDLFGIDIVHANDMQLFSILDDRDVLVPQNLKSDLIGTFRNRIDSTLVIMIPRRAIDSIGSLQLCHRLSKWRDLVQMRRNKITRHENNVRTDLVDRSSDVPHVVL